MTRHKIIILLFIFVSGVRAQTTVDTKTVTIKNDKYKKVIKFTEDVFTLYFDAQDYLSTLDSNSVTKSKLATYFATNDTLRMTPQTEKQLNLWLIKDFTFYKNSALGFGRVSVYNNKTKSFEKYFINVNTTIIDKKETKIKVSTKTTETYELFSADKKHVFVGTSLVGLSDRSK
ncbi:MAG: hypothetical protein ACXVNO_06355 [Bacteroidia bacterium]